LWAGPAGEFTSEISRPLITDAAGVPAWSAGARHGA
jgi:hypothetical protein